MRTKREWVNTLADEYEHEILLLEGPEFDGAIVGLVYRFGMDPVVCYDRAKLIEMMTREAWENRETMGISTMEEAEEVALDNFGFNTEGCWAGDGTWAFLITPDVDVLEA